MPRIKITQEFLRNSRAPVLYVTKRFVIFSPSAVIRLHLKIKDRFVFEIENDIIYVRPSEEEGFTLTKEIYNCLESHHIGVLEYFEDRIEAIPLEQITKITRLSFSIGKPVNGTYPLHFLSYKFSKKNQTPKK